jgi:hypothetical protein
MEKKKNLFKNSLILLALLSFFFSLPEMVQAQLVPCGGEGQPECEFCHLFVLFDNIVKFVLRSLVPPIAALMLVIGGGMFFAAAGDPSKVGKAKSVITSVAIGLVIVYGAYLLINLFFWAIGVADWTGLENWFIYPCEPST